MTTPSKIYTDRIHVYHEDISYSNINSQGQQTIVDISGTVIMESHLSLVDPSTYDSVSKTKRLYLANNCNIDPAFQSIYITANDPVTESKYLDISLNVSMQFYNNVLGSYTGGFVFYQNSNTGYTQNAIYESARINKGTITTKVFNTTSDYRIKEEVEDIGETDLQQFDNIHPVSFFLKDSETLQYGMIAHELQEIYPHLVTGEKDGETMQSINYIGLIPLLIKSVQDLKKEVAFLKSRRDF